MQMQTIDCLSFEMSTSLITPLAQFDYRLLVSEPDKCPKFQSSTTRR
jgi:hypothetical protein